MLHPCPSWNRVNTFAWYKGNTFLLEGMDWKPKGRVEALGLLLSEKRLPLGVLCHEKKTPFEDRHPVLQEDPLALRPLPSPREFAPLLDEFR